METSPLVSVLMTAYNRQKYIGEAIESVLASSYTNFELIIVDDFSSDKTVEIAYQYQAKDNRIQVFKNNKNLGQFTNRNKAIELSKGDFIKFLDSDDCLNENALSVMMKAFVEFPDAGLGLPIKDRFEKTPYQLQPHESVLFHFGGNNHLCYGPSATIYTRAAIERLGGFECEYGILADTLLI